jgi:hypothetical protein
VVDDAMTESTRKSAPSTTRRSLVEVVTRGEPRRRWSEEERARILAEAMAPGAIASHVARRFGVSTGQFYTWRKAMLLRSAPVGVTPALAKVDFGLVAYLCRSGCSFRLPGVRRPGGFCLPKLNAFGAGYRSR